MLLKSVFLIAVLITTSFSTFANSDVNALANRVTDRSMIILNEVITQIGARPAGSQQEKNTVKLVADIWQQANLTRVQRQSFNVEIKGQVINSQNIWVTLPGDSAKHIVIGAHYDSTGVKAGSQGATDNGVAMALVTALAEQLSAYQLNATVTFVLFGAEEVGLQGAKAFVNQMVKSGQVPEPDSMINLDTIAGGDKLYIHSPTQTPYKSCNNTSTYNASPAVRGELLLLAKNKQLAFNLHPSFPGYPEGETAGWSDHAPFACAGIPIAYIEATNFAINGRDGFDGYSQSLHPGLWDCLDTSLQTACDRDTEERWGRIWHTGQDRLDTLETLHPGRLRAQLSDVSELLVDYLIGDVLTPRHGR
ncbi:M28 family metallopeptidase [Alteromonas gilva]|uniref:M28 family peptidase n=1 Tax=Alteromonas gilva TaxID=2987522 RepID=A0ABT5L437_9ALTE|nr:M28 family peptidase [Alteromonas gilva]MDC8831613.1 M28 family peptidase [Alteromonas gilva]